MAQTTAHYGGWGTLKTSNNRNNLPDNKREIIESNDGCWQVNGGKQSLQFDKRLETTYKSDGGRDTLKAENN